MSRATARRGSTGGGVDESKLDKIAIKQKIQRTKSVSTKTSTVGKKKPTTTATKLITAKKTSTSGNVKSSPSGTPSKTTTATTSKTSTTKTKPSPQRRKSEILVGDKKKSTAKATPTSTPSKSPTSLITPSKNQTMVKSTNAKGSVSAIKPGLANRRHTIGPMGSKTPSGNKTLPNKTKKTKLAPTTTTTTTTTTATGKNSKLVSKSSQTLRPTSKQKSPPKKSSTTKSPPKKKPPTTTTTTKKTAATTTHLTKKTKVISGTLPARPKSQSSKTSSSTAKNKVRKVINVAKKHQQSAKDDETSSNNSSNPSTSKQLPTGVVGIETKTINKIKRKSLLAEKLLMLQEQANAAKQVVVSNSEEFVSSGPKRAVTTFGLSPKLIEICKALGQVRGKTKRTPVGWMIVQEMETDFHVYESGPEVAQQGLDAIISKLTSDQVSYFFLNTAAEGPTVKAVLGVWVAQGAKEIFKARSQAGRDRLRDLTFEYFTTRAKFTVTDQSELTLKSIQNIMMGFTGGTSLKSDNADREEKALKASQARDASAPPPRKPSVMRSAEEQEKLRQLMEQNKDSHIYFHEGQMYRIEFEDRKEVEEALQEFQKSASIGGSHFMMFSLENTQRSNLISPRKFSDTITDPVPIPELNKEETEEVEKGEDENLETKTEVKEPRDAAAVVEGSSEETSKKLEIERDQRIDSSEPNTETEGKDEDINEEAEEAEEAKEENEDEDQDETTDIGLTTKLVITTEPTTTTPTEKKEEKKTSEEANFLSSTFEVIIPSTPVKTPTASDYLVIPDASDNNSVPATPLEELSVPKVFSPTSSTLLETPRASNYNFVELLSVGATTLTDDWKEKWLPEDGVRVFAITFQTTAGGYGLKTYTMVVCWLGHLLKFHQAFKFRQSFGPLVDFIRKNLGIISGSIEVRSHEEVSLEILMDRVLGTKLRGAEQKVSKGADKFKNSNFGVKKDELTYEGRASIVECMRELSNEPDTAHPEKTATWMLIGYKENETSVLQLQARGHVSSQGFLTHGPTVEDFKAHLKRDNICFVILRFFYIPDQFHDFPGDLFRYLRSQWLLFLWHGPDIDVIGRALSSHHWKSFSEWARNIMDAQGAIVNPGHYHATAISEVSYTAIRDFLRLTMLEKRPKALQNKQFGKQ